jgi:tripartite-type tricarboxylate transporter receptor subunit TctC
MLAAALAAGSPFTAFGQARFEPTKPVRIVVPFGAGGATDILARTLSEKLTRAFGQPVLVENRAGASGIIGIGEVARAPADGHTLLVTNTALLQTPLMDNKVAYEETASRPWRSCRCRRWSLASTRRCLPRT